jgi:hypothetical protein
LISHEDTKARRETIKNTILSFPEVLSDVLRVLSVKRPVWLVCQRGKAMSHLKKEANHRVLVVPKGEKNGREDVLSLPATEER